MRSGRAPSDLLERGDVLLELSRMLGEAAEGRGRLVFVAGEAGIGKTTLVRRFAELVGAGATVLIGGCDPLSTPPPLGPLLDVAPQLPGPPLRMGDGKDVLFRNLLEALGAAGRPLVLVFEDVHWADEATLDLVRFLARRIDRRTALLIATHRDDEMGPRHPLRLVLGDVATAPAVHRLTLQPLSGRAVRELAAGSGMDPVALLERTGGNPFFVTEILAADDETIPATVRDAVLARVARLAEPARAVLAAAAVIGTRVEPPLLERIAADDAPAVGACLDAGVIRVRDGFFEFRHALARDAVLATILPHRRMQLNREVLGALRAAPLGKRDPARLAHHAEEAGDGAAVLEYAPEAARQARSADSRREAAAHFARALRFADSLLPARRAELLEDYSVECAATDQYDEAIRAARELIALRREQRDRVGEGRACSILSGWLVRHGRNAEAEEASRTAIQVLETLPPGPELAEAYVAQSSLRMLNRDSTEAIAWARRALELAEPGGYLRIRTMAFNRLGSAMIVSGNGEGDAYLRRALELAGEADLPWEVANAYLTLGSAWGEWYEFGRAESYLLQGIGYAGEHDLDGLGMYMVAWHALVLMYLGRLSEAEETARRVAQRGSVNVTSRIMALVALGRVSTRRGDPEAADVLDEALALALPTGTLQRIAPVRAARAEAAWLAGDLERVRAEAAAALDLALEKRHSWMAGELLFWLGRAGAAGERPEWIARPFALQLARAWREAAAEWRARGCPYEAAEALAEAGGAEDLRAALAEFERLGARPAAERTLRRLRELRVRGIPRGPRQSTRSHPSGLTRREAEVAALLTEGLRDAEIAKRLFLSTRTVGHHVSRVLAKLGVRTRLDAARVLHAAQTPDEDD